ncbi:MAG: hypothetical protein ACRERW_07755 [Pseudomonas sp.]
MATDSIRNALAGEIRGNQVSLTTLKGDIVNDRTAIAAGEGSGMRTLVDEGGNISARDTLTIKSARDLTNSSAISSGGDASLSATRDLNLLRPESRRVQRWRQCDHQLRTRHHAGGNLTLISEGDQRYQVAKLESGKDITLDSGFVQGYLWSWGSHVEDVEYRPT